MKMVRSENRPHPTPVNMTGEHVPKLVTSWYTESVRIISRRTLRLYWEKHADAATALQTWYHSVEHASWKKPEDIKAMYADASFVGNRVIFNIKGNRYRLVVVVVYRSGTVYIRFVGTHQEYDDIDVRKI